MIIFWIFLMDLIFSQTKRGCVFIFMRIVFIGRKIHPNRIKLSHSTQNQGWWVDIVDASSNPELAFLRRIMSAGTGNHLHGFDFKRFQMCEGRPSGAEGTNESEGDTRFCDAKTWGSALREPATVTSLWTQIARSALQKVASLHVAWHVEVYVDGPRT